MPGRWKILLESFAFTGWVWGHIPSLDGSTHARPLSEGAAGGVAAAAAAAAPADAAKPKRVRKPKGEPEPEPAPEAEPTAAFEPAPEPDAVRLHAHGLRTLAPNDPHFHAKYTGDQFHRDGAYHIHLASLFDQGKKA